MNSSRKYYFQQFFVSKAILAFALFLSFNSFSSIRQPAYYILGEEEFSGVQVYDAIQDNDWNYWFSTNEGLYFYDHYTFKKIFCEESKSISFFNFVINQDGVIFCNNLNDQIFSIENGTCTLFYELQTDEKRNDVSLAVSKENNLLITGLKLVVLDNKGAVLTRHPLNQGYIGLPYCTLNGEIIYSCSNANSVIVYNSANISVLPLRTEQNKNFEENSVLLFFRIDDHSFAVDMFHKSLYSFDEKNFSVTEIASNDLLKRSLSIRIYSTNDNIWAAGTLPGTIIFDRNMTPDKTSLWYPDFFISDIYQDREGNILLSTFDQGILVISDTEQPDLIRDFKDDPITAFSSPSKKGFIAGTTKGKLIAYDFQNFKSLSEAGTRPIEMIITNREKNLVFFDDGYMRCYNTKTNHITDIASGSLKDGVFVDDLTAFLSTNSGLSKITFEDLSYTKFNIENIEALSFRNYAISYDPINSLIYASTVNGIYCLDSTNKERLIQFENETLFSSTLCQDLINTYAPQNNNSIFVLSKGKVIDKFELELEKTTRVFKVKIFNNSLFANTSEGLFEFDKKGKLKRHFNISQDMHKGRILDFEITDNSLWMSSSKGIQTIDLNYLIKPTPIPEIYVSHVFANDIEVQKDSILNFDSDTRKFKFVLSSPTLKYKSEIKYHYQLKGYDPDWIINDYFENEILYNALAPGNYEFVVKAENQNEFSDAVSFKFSIATPFYASWWFISILIISFLILVYLIYRRQLNLQQIKAQQINELNASKLTAIQSQMNPHFIFNSLNSIQDLILKGDVERSYSYITTFSNLVRRTLSYSDKDFIDFEQELKLLELYLSLEKLRFKKDFSFNIITNDITDIQIPPMLIQPFIENALVHGLLHKEGEKKLTITFTLNHHLICVVEDNGIGREQAKAIKLRQRSDHESFSVQAIRKRFEILSEHFKGELGYTYSDLIENGKAVGTRVTIQLPIKRKF